MARIFMSLVADTLRGARDLMVEAEDGVVIPREGDPFKVDGISYTVSRIEWELFTDTAMGMQQIANVYLKPVARRIESDPPGPFAIDVMPWADDDDDDPEMAERIAALRAALNKANAEHNEMEYRRAVEAERAERAPVRQ